MLLPVTFSFVWRESSVRAAFYLRGAIMGSSTIGPSPGRAKLPGVKRSNSGLSASGEHLNARYRGSIVHDACATDAVVCEHLHHRMIEEQVERNSFFTRDRDEGGLDTRDVELAAIAANGVRPDRIAGPDEPQTKRLGGSGVKLGEDFQGVALDPGHAVRGVIGVEAGSAEVMATQFSQFVGRLLAQLSVAAEGQRPRQGQATVAADGLFEAVDPAPHQASPLRVEQTVRGIIVAVIQNAAFFGLECVGSGVKCADKVIDLAMGREDQHTTVADFETSRTLDIQHYAVRMGEEHAPVFPAGQFLVLRLVEIDDRLDPLAAVQVTPTT